MSEPTPRGEVERVSGALGAGAPPAGMRVVRRTEERGTKFVIFIYNRTDGAHVKLITLYGEQGKRPGS